jgi:hypothetical protein
MRVVGWWTQKCPAQRSLMPGADSPLGISVYRKGRFSQGQISLWGHPGQWPAKGRWQACSLCSVRQLRPVQLELWVSPGWQRPLWLTGVFHTHTPVHQSQPLFPGESNLWQYQSRCQWTIIHLTISLTYFSNINLAIINIHVNIGYIHVGSLHVGVRVPGRGQLDSWVHRILILIGVCQVTFQT